MEGITHGLIMVISSLKIKIITLTTRNRIMQQTHQKRAKMYKPKRLMRMHVIDVG